MKKSVILALVAMVLPVVSFAQTSESAFRGYFYNDEYNVYINIDLYKKNITVPNHDIFGALPGYLGKKNNSFYWIVIEGRVMNEMESELELVNDYGSEDFKATFGKQNDSVYVLRQKAGSTLKVPNNGKWQKLPKELKFIKKRP